jgi:hypothetical protein
VLAAMGAAAATTVLLHLGANPGPGEAAPSQVVTDLVPSPVSGDTREITCWDGTATSAVKECGVPAGRAGLVTVFPSLSERCTETDPLVGGKVEVFTCRGEGHVIRYTRWKPGFDRFAVFTEENGGSGGEWKLGGDLAGRRWSSQGTTSDSVRHFLWTATYRAQPFSVEVQATTKAGRSAGVAAVKVVAPRRLGRS